MATSYRQFIHELYEEHVEEACFLYEQRLSFLIDQELEWFASHNEELRFEAHLDGLIVGGEQALLVCKEQAMQGEVGAIYTLICLYCQRPKNNEILSVINDFDLEDEDIRQAIQLALQHRMPASWDNADLQQKLSEHFHLLSLFLPVLIKNHSIPQNLVAAYMSQQTEPNEQIDPIPFIHAAGYFQDKNTHQQLDNFFVKGTEAEKNASVLAQFRLGNTHIVDNTKVNGDTQFIPLLSLTIGASSCFFTQLIEHAEHTAWTEELINCVAIGGVAEFIPMLIKLLKQDEIADFVAKALFTITGARLLENTLKEETWLEEELFEDELEAFKQGVMPQRTDGRPFGEEVQQLSADFEVWLNWWKQNHAKYVAGKRYRGGVLISPVSLVKTLNSTLGNYVIRELTYQELTNRYNANLYFSTKDYIHEQQKSIFELYQWATKVENSYIKGDWYFSGNKQQ